MKKVFTKTYSYALLVATLAVFLFSCANPVQFDSSSAASSKALVGPTLIVNNPTYKAVLQLKNGSTIDSLKLDRAPAEGDTLGPITFTKVYYKGSEAIGFDFTSTQPVIAVYVKASTGGNRYDYPSTGVFGDSELFTQVNSDNHLNYGISHVDFAWLVGDFTPPQPPVTPTKVISGYAFHDLDKDGVKDSGEPGLAGVVVAIDRDGAPVTTGSNGFYSFGNLSAAAYTVTAGDLAGYYHTSPAALNPTASADNVNFGFTYETVSGFVFYDLDNDGLRDAGEPALADVAVTLDKEGTPVTATSDADGFYRFDYLKPVLYTLTVADLTGFVHTTPNSLTVTATAENVDFGFFVDYGWINGQTANGFTIGYWKTNLDKAIANKTAGTQVSKSTLLGYVAELSSFALGPLNVTTLDAASKILSKTGSVPTDLLAKQLMGSEFNYANNAYIGGNALVTYFFLYQGEYMLVNASSFGSTQLLAQKDKYDAYNNSHGGAILF